MKIFYLVIFFLTISCTESPKVPLDLVPHSPFFIFNNTPYYLLSPESYCDFTNEGKLHDYLAGADLSMAQRLNSIPNSFKYVGRCP